MGLERFGLGVRDGVPDLWAREVAPRCGELGYIVD